MFVTASNTAVTLIEGVGITAIGGLILTAGIAVSRYVDKGHDLKVTKEKHFQQQLRDVVRWAFGTPADPISGTGAVPGAIETLPVMKKQVDETHDMVADLLAAQKGVQQ